MTTEVETLLREVTDLRALTRHIDAVFRQVKENEDRARRAPVKNEATIARWAGLREALTGWRAGVHQTYASKRVRLNELGGVVESDPDDPRGPPLGFLTDIDENTEADFIEVSVLDREGKFHKATVSKLAAHGMAVQIMEAIDRFEQRATRRSRS